MASSGKTAGPTMNVLVTVDEPHRGELAEVAGRLESAGLSKTETFEIGGIIAGEVAHSDLAKLHKVEGIKAIEEDASVFAER